ncbi:Fur family transcriptional regulator [Treponema sp.]|uniref:Fur family transcriptional regulator n=1 Tax=Treponema sp. TaxID=166 RepID=UPI0025ED8E99|nr:transcriptional repressor [Treponema sp.]MCR5217874.1 transcriptional repressor [Treponema sp.]
MQNRNSAQRNLILSIMEGNKSHPTADEIYEQARQSDPHISRGTVYRNLNLLVENELLLRVPVPGAPDHFDSMLDQHYHFYCRNCNRVFDVPEFNTEDVQAVETKLGKMGFKSITHKIVFEGLCPECSKK